MLLLLLLLLLVLIVALAVPAVVFVGGDVAVAWHKWLGIAGLVLCPSQYASTTGPIQSLLRIQNFTTKPPIFSCEIWNNKKQKLNLQTFISKEGNKTSQPPRPRLSRIQLESVILRLLKGPINSAISIVPDLGTEYHFPKHLFTAIGYSYTVMEFQLQKKQKKYYEIMKSKIYN